MLTYVTLKPIMIKLLRYLLLMILVFLTYVMIHIQITFEQFNSENINYYQKYVQHERVSYLPAVCFTLEYYKGGFRREAVAFNSAEILINKSAGGTILQKSYFAYVYMNERTKDSIILQTIYIKSRRKN